MVGCVRGLGWFGSIEGLIDSLEESVGLDEIFESKLFIAENINFRLIVYR